MATDPVPDTIVSVASQSGSGGATGQPLVQTANDGYSDPTGVATSSGTHYLKETTSPFTITVSPMASVSATAPATVTAMASATAGGITITTYIPSISLSGTTLVSGQQEALTGQQITATVNAPFFIDPNTYHWDVSGSMFNDGAI